MARRALAGCKPVRNRLEPGKLALRKRVSWVECTAPVQEAWGSRVDPRKLARRTMAECSQMVCRSWIPTTSDENVTDLYMKCLQRLVPHLGGWREIGFVAS